MSLFSRQQNQPKPVKIAGQDYYRLKDAATILNISKSTLSKGLGKKFPFRFSRFDDFHNAPIYISATDVHAYLRQREQDFLKRLRR